MSDHVRSMGYGKHRYAPLLAMFIFSHNFVGTIGDIFFVWRTQNNYYFMDSETFEEVAVGANIVGDNSKWIVEGMEVSLVNFKEGVIEVVVPNSANYEIIETEPNVKGNTAQGYTKPATLSSGAVINVPGYLEQGEMIRVDTEKGEFQERVKS